MWGEEWGWACRRFEVRPLIWRPMCFCKGGGQGGAKGVIGSAGSGLRQSQERGWAGGLVDMLGANKTEKAVAVRRTVPDLRWQTRAVGAGRPSLGKPPAGSFCPGASPPDPS